ncbi:MAG: hypothetical protein KJ069_30935 [Anaerolineae bacterium]|nr:hypothetical protein [Anaerolineae bacterium]
MKLSDSERHELQNLIFACFQPRKLLTFCWLLDILYEAIHRDTFEQTLVELIKYGETHDLLGELLNHCRNTFSFQDLPASFQQSLTEYDHKEAHTIRTSKPNFIGVKPRDMLIRRFRLDTALPESMQHGRSFELAIAIRQPDSPILQEDDLDKTKSGHLPISWPEDVDDIALHAQVSAPECEIHGKDNCSLRLYFGISYGVQMATATALRAFFNQDELRQLCFKLPVPFEDLPEDTHTAKVRELVLYMVCHGRFMDLIQQYQLQRPHVEWEALADIVPAGGVGQ